ncbi:hypothetical protein DICPUDRAFT_33780 [Dictyostelium purpureum]|uniref:Acyl-coenzyme A oxidase n=1 Tax=Dictyostelium purpureum TaxID=5786 RepID=F0ZLJ3_DICPU|nr:uncharacterized protein DICPUDRAFT_33780 [Dictyostelium purpureum]EGC35201.1 hypothetical protein DICPUDRAFT_33780 [Dictyostelium purpureum]|eukprot:XP_003288289.1 hypothetical protein DICPUDRAFT_33780 [Dictyostelium purpureum]
MYCNKYKNNKTNKDLEFERNQATFSVEELNRILNDNDQNSINIKNEIKNLIESDPIISKPQEIHFLSREDQFKRVLYVCSKLRGIRQKYGEAGVMQYHNNLFEELPYIINDLVFASAFKSLASEEQLNKWYHHFLNYEYLGSYSQTELGHGSNVQAIETTATYIKETQEFEINSPTLTSTKWWVGGLGKLSTHTIVFAQLLLQDPENPNKLKNYGPHPFLVSVRSLENHQPLKGITIGDIGPKLGFNLIDNGFLRLDHIRVPRDQLLNRFFNVTADGKYIKPKHSRLIYAGMVGVRSAIIENSFVSLARSTTIASRYSVIRKQFKLSPKDNEERKVIEYANQMQRIIPHIASTFGFYFTGNRFAKEFDQMISQIKVNQDTTLLSELHANSSALKSYLTYAAAQGVSECRLSCGGHGYSHFSGIPYLQANQLHIVTAEGENNLLPQQTTKYLLSIIKKLSTSEDVDQVKLGKSVEYLRDEMKSTLKNIEEYYSGKDTSILHPDTLLQLFKHRSFNLLRILSENLQDAMMNSKDLASVWGDLNVEINHIGQAHAQLYVLQSFYDQLLKIKNSNQVSEPIKSLMDQLFQCYCLYTINNEMVDFVQDGYLDLKEVDQLRKSLTNVYKQLRPNIIPIVDSFDLCDATLGSALGNYSGNVYDTLFNWASTQAFNSNTNYTNEINNIINKSLYSKL